MSYQDQVTQMQGAGFSGPEIQGWSDNQAVKLRQAGFNQDEVDSYQDMKAPTPGTPPVYGRVPTDKDFSNAASVILGGNDHPSYDKTVNSLKDLNAQTGVHPAEAVKASQNIPAFRDIMENADNAPSFGDYASKFGHEAISTIAEMQKGAVAIGQQLNPNSPWIPEEEKGKAPEDTLRYQRADALQKWINDKLPQNPKMEQEHPISMGIAGGAGGLVPLLATGGVGMGLSGAQGSYEQEKQAGASTDQARMQATKMGAVWGALGVVDVGMFLKPVERSAPGFMPWMVAKGQQAVRSGLTFAGTNEFGDWLNSQIAQDAGIPIQYKPTLQRVVTSSLTGVLVGSIVPTNLKSQEGVKPTAEQPFGPTGLEPSPPASAPASILKPAYHFDTDTYGLNDAKGNFVKTGFGSEEEAERAIPAATQQANQRPVRTPVEPEAFEKNKAKIAEESQKNGFELTPQQLEKAAQVKTESDQAIIPGTEPISDKELAERKMATPTESAAQQKPANEGLFDVGGRGQEELFMPRGPQKTPMNALQFIASKGGIWDEVLNGDLRGMDAHKRYGQLMRKNGIDVDEMGGLLHDAGYFGPPDTTARPTTHDVLEVIRDGLNGKHTYAEADRARIEQRAEKEEGKSYRGNLEDEADRFGIDHKGLSDEKLTDELRDAHVVEQAKLEYQHELTDADVEHLEREGMQGYYGPNWRPEHAEEVKNTEEPGVVAASKAGLTGQETATGVTAKSAERGGRSESGNEEPKLPRTLAGAKPRYSFGVKRFTLEFESDVDKAMYITSQGNKSKRDADYRNFLTEQGYTDREIDVGGRAIRNQIKQQAKNHSEFGDTDKVSNIEVTKQEPSNIAFQKGIDLSQQANEILKPVLDFIRRVAPQSALEVREDAIRTPDGDIAHGSYDRLKNLITLSLKSPDQLATTAHESIHAVRDLLTDKEWKKLTYEANKRDLIKKYDIESRYENEHEEEMIAHWFSDWAKDNSTEAPKAIKTLFQKILDALSGLAKIIRSFTGNQSAEDIFSKIESGEIGQREAGEQHAEGTLYEKAKEEEKPTISDAINGIRDTFVPSAAGEKAKQTEVAIRGSYGEAKRRQAIAESALNEFARQAVDMNDHEVMDFYNHAEGRTQGIQLKNKQFQAMADTIRDIYARYKGYIEAMPETRMMNFVTDYFPHMWEPGQEKEIKEFLNSYWQQGSGRNLKERIIPKIADGLEYGLKLKEKNPVRATSAYVGTMSHYMASVDILRTINNDLGGGYYADGKQPEGYVPLVGRNAERIENARIDLESGKLVPARNLKLYAPQQVADLYNAFYSKGFEDTKLKSAYMLARDAINTNTMMELGLSAYHFNTITVQSLNQDMSRILRNAVAGDWAGVSDAIKGLVTPTLHFQQGMKLMDQYKDLADHGVDMERIADLFARSNLRLGIDPLSNVRTHGGFYKAWQRGELPALIDRLKGQLTEGYGTGALKSGAEVISRVVSDVAHPLFNVYIPAIKMSAFHDLMGDWMRQNKDATDAEISRQAVRIGDLVEDRFGEMNMENIFWNKKAKEILGLSLRAPGWDIGLVRQTGGAGVDVYHIINDAIRGKGFDQIRLDRPLFMVGAAINLVAINAAMTYFKTGVMPSDQKLKDWLAYATGGMHKAFGWHPERAEIPGHARELIQIASIPGKGPLSGVEQEISNKVSTLPKRIYEAVSNQDWKGKPIYDPKSNNWITRTLGVAQAAHVAKGFEPFSMEQMFDGKPEGSNLSFAERFMGVRSAGAKIVNPEGLRQFNEQKNH